MKILAQCIFGILSFICVTSSHAVTQKAQIIVDKSLPHHGPYYAVQLPIALYPASLSAQLTDVRVRNANGDYLLYAWADASIEETSPSRIHCPIFPITVPSVASSATSADGLNVYVGNSIRRNGDGSLSSMTQIATRNLKIEQSNLVAAWIIDVSGVAGNKHLLRAHFEIDAQQNGIATFRLEASDDLQQWRVVSDHEQLVQLQHEGERIQKLDVQLPYLFAKYLRVVWKEPKSSFVLRKASIDTQTQDFKPAPMQWSSLIEASHCEPYFCDYAVPKNTPVDSLRVVLNEVNTTAKMQVIGEFTAPLETYQRHHHFRNPLYVLRHQKRLTEADNSRHVFLADATFYRLNLTQGEVHSEDLPLNGFPYSSLRLQSKTPLQHLGKLSPNIQIGTMTRALLFLARGKEPYHIEWGSQSAEGAAVPISTIMPNAALARSLQTSDAQLEFPIAVNTTTLSPKASVPAPNEKFQTAGQNLQRKIWLWLALLLGLLLLAGMVWTLSRSMKVQPEKE